jgi:cell wall-associated NlpC family hydrolase
MTTYNRASRRARTAFLVSAAATIAGGAGLVLAPAASAAQVQPRASYAVDAALPGMNNAEDAIAAYARQALDAYTAMADLPLSGRLMADSSRSDYNVARHSLALLVSLRTSADPVELEQRWIDTDPRRLVAVYTALAQVGTPYHYRSMNPGVGFDCSGLTNFAWRAAGVDLPRSSRAQIAAVEKLTMADLQPGDLVYAPGHVVLYLGAGLASVEAPESGKRVRVTDLHPFSWLRFGDPLN